VKIIVLISAIVEWRVVREIVIPGDIQNTPYGESFDITLGDKEFTFFHSGWGKTASAGAMQYVIDHYSPKLIINLGTCGGFEGLVELNEIILVEQTFIYDIVELMGDFELVLDYYASNLDLSWLSKPYPYPVRRGILASADADLLPEKIPQLKEQGVIAADWESAALAWVAKKNNARLLILRGVSDLVSEKSGEAYNNISLFEVRTREVMRRLIDQLPGWVAATKP